MEQCRQRADQRCEGTFLSSLRSTIKHYDSCTLTECHVHLKRGQVHYALLPVWMLNTKWRGKDFIFAMNGKTGKLVGDLPINWWKVVGVFAAVAIPLALLGSALSFFL